MNKLNIVGEKYGRLMVLESAEPVGGRSAWKCRCDCGTEKVIKTEELRSGDTKSCGCWNNEQRSARAKNMYSAITKYTPVEAHARHTWKSNYSDMIFEDFYELSQQDCFYCKCKPSNTSHSALSKTSSQNMKEGFVYNGLDRVDNTLPHSRENCVACCKYCNFSKRERTISEFKEWITQLYEHFVVGK